MSIVMGALACWLACSLLIVLVISYFDIRLDSDDEAVIIVCGPLTIVTLIIIAPFYGLIILKEVLTDYCRTAKERKQHKEQIKRSARIQAERDNKNLLTDIELFLTQNNTRK